MVFSAIVQIRYGEGIASTRFARLQAPVKRVYEFTASGHNADAEEPERYNDLLVTTVLRETYRR